MARSYTYEEKATAIAIIQAHGGTTQGALDQILEALGRTPSRSTLHDWLQKVEFGSDSESAESKRIVKRNPTAEDVEHASVDVRKRFMDIIDKYTSRAVDADVLSGLKGTQAVTGAAIAFDKLLKLEGLENIPDDLLRRLPDFIVACEVHGFNPTAVIIGMTEDLLQRANNKNDSAVH